MNDTIPNGFHRTQDWKDTHTQNALQKQVFTIYLSKQKTPTVMNWRCHNCGSLVFQYYNLPNAIFDGAMNIADCEQPTDHLCKKCNIIFRVT